MSAWAASHQSCGDALGIHRRHSVHNRTNGAKRRRLRQETAAPSPANREAAVSPIALSGAVRCRLHYLEIAPLDMQQAKLQPADENARCVKSKSDVSMYDLSRGEFGGGATSAHGR